MLVLTRRLNESLHIIDRETGERITVCVCRRERGHVHVGIEASGRFKILREEVRERDVATEDERRTEA